MIMVPEPNSTRAVCLHGIIAIVMSPEIMPVRLGKTCSFEAGRYNNSSGHER